ncbi:DUF1217 domain-containing protein [Roseobacter sp. CCS2]|uniref:DUF1217 domain-containing protein n=1 Tax=Roseobacter sp. CCS2 TaxID=391593 RepID=UPI0000F40527|nr:DUF1217 domain-containing protein [Roseobacter sp. CCS2]EBA13830.1 flagellar protein, putative [Roseobacter sp. CCS2]
MSFQPVLPLQGYIGWRFLERTAEAQQTAFSNSAPIQRATDYFRENIGDVRTASDLVNDRQLLSIALGAFGLDDDINNRAFIQKILEDGTVAQDALANRLADNRYADFSAAFGFGDSPIPRTVLGRFPTEIIDRFEAQQFARAIGEQNNDMRLASNVNSGVADIVAGNATNTGRWFSIMGNAPLREVFQTALGLPNSLAGIDIDKQREVFQERALSVFGTDDVAQIATPKQEEKLIRLFLIRSEANDLAASSAGTTALTLLQSAPRLFA